LLVQLPDHATVADALGLMLVHDITSIPVYSVRREYVGIISAFDLAIVIAFGEVFKSNGELNETFSNLGMRLRDLIGITSESQQIWCFNQDEPLSVALEPMCKGIHHILVRDPVSFQYRMLSQSDVIRAVAKRLDEVGIVKEKTLEELFAPLEGKSKVVTVRNDTPAIDAFKKLWTLSVSAVAVVDDGGNVVGSLSASDLRGLGPRQLRFLKKPVLQFQEAMLGAHPKDPVCLSPKLTLSEAIKEVSENRVHFAWIVESGKPVSVVSLTNMIEALK
jgi:CBS domain-containing protein